MEAHMVSVLSLWLPILLSAIAVFVLSSLIHMVLGYHKNDFLPLPNEDAALNALQPLNIPKGEYLFPRPASMADMKSEAFIARWKRGPVGMLTIMPNDKFTMAPQLVGWFVYSIVISIFAGYVASRALGPGADYIQVFRFVSTTAFLGYAGALWQQTIWYHHSVATTLKATFDGLLYALVTAGFFGWLWP
jgi:hypothetical protein